MSTDLGKDCRRLRERLPEHADGTLTGRLRRRMERHLAECARCSAELEEVRTVIAAVRSVGAEAVPESLVPRVRRAVAAQAPAPGPGFQFWARIAVPVAVATGLVAIGFAFRAIGLREAAMRGQVPTLAAATEAAPGQHRPLHIAEAKGEPAVIKEGDRSAVRAFPPAPQEALQDRLGRGFANGRDEALMRVASPEAVVGAERKQREETTQAARSPLPAHRPDGRDGTLDVHAGGEVCRETGAWRRAAMAAELGPGAAPEEAPPRPPIAARALLLKDGERRAIGLMVQAEAPLGEVAVHIEGREGRRLVWQGSAEEAAPFALSEEQLGPGPAQIPIEVESRAGSRRYVLFIPTMARLGEIAPTAPRGSYRGVPLSRALADLSALTGLVILAEAPLDETISAELPGGLPETALRRLAEPIGFEVSREDGLVHILVHRR